MSNAKNVLCGLLVASAALFCAVYAAPVEVNTLSPDDIAALTNNTDFADILNGANITVINSTTTSSNGTEKQLYVIKAVVYEVGILTEVDDNSSYSSESHESHERVDLTFFNAHKNGSVFDFGDIPVPIQANITGHTYTEILPVHIGDGVMNISDLTSILPLPENVLNFTQSDDTLFQYNSRPIHNHPLTEADLPHDDLPLLADEQPLQYQNFPLPQDQHLSETDLLKIPLIANPIVVDVQPLDDNTNSSSSSSEEESSPQSVSH